MCVWEVSDWIAALMCVGKQRLDRCVDMFVGNERLDRCVDVCVWGKTAIGSLR